MPLFCGRLLALFSMLKLCQLQSDGLQLEALARRAFLSGATVTASAFVLGMDLALADPMQALIPGSSAMPRMQPYTDGSNWSQPRLSTKLGSRITSSSLSPIQQIPFAPQELYYAPFLFGSWNVTATLKQKVYPFGREFVPSKSLVEGSPRNREEQVGDATSYQVHYFSTLANTAANKITVNLGLGVPQPSIIADRAFNIVSMSGAYRHLAPVESVDWDYREDPTRLTLRFGAAPVADDMRPLGQRRGEVYLTARQSEQSDSDSTVYCTAERSRSVTLGPGFTFVSDQEAITEFSQLDDDTVVAVQRIAVYLTPNPNSREGVLWQQVGGKAVAFFDYELELKRTREEFFLADGSTVLRPCVMTPNDIIQCE
jgi:hypothetical protein